MITVKPLTGNILITGGTGTLGTSIVRVARERGWSGVKFTIFARSELRLAQMKARYPECRYVVGDIRDAQAIKSALMGHDGCIHAAAMKRIPECEKHPLACIESNVHGSSNVILGALEARLAWCVGISTDKACGAITTYGASKRLMESVLTGLAGEGETKFTYTRYGNVMESNGSVVELWNSQVVSGAPATITHPDMTRFWMTPRDAVDCISIAVHLAPGTGWVPRMKSMRMGDLFELVHGDYPHRIVGLRSLEKMHEDLVATDELSHERHQGFVLGEGLTGGKFTSDSAVRYTREGMIDLMSEVAAFKQG